MRAHTGVERSCNEAVELKVAGQVGGVLKVPPDNLRPPAVVTAQSMVPSLRVSHILNLLYFHLDL
jgi:hypothetical protein